MKKIFGNYNNLKSSQIRKLEKLYQRKSPVEFLISKELSKEICQISYEIKRQIGLLIDRRGHICFVILGDSEKIIIPNLEDYRMGYGRLKGLRCIHTHLNSSSLSNDDLTDLALLRLDLMSAITIDENGFPDKIFIGHLLPANNEKKTYSIFDPINQGELNIDCLNMIMSLEEEMAQAISKDKKNDSSIEKALLISVTTRLKSEAEQSLDELANLAKTGKVKVIDRIIQQRKKIDSRFLMGKGKISEITILALQYGATLLIFDQELNPSQIRSITDYVSIKIIDRTQLILDIFAQRAVSKEGKLQVELAQLKYMLPRLITKNTAMSRLTGGIGGRGPGETKLEINRRRVRDRIQLIEKNLKQVQKHRKIQRSKRLNKQLPIISIIGYTNAGKSTLLNTLTNSNVLTENKLFATLDTSSRRLRFPKDMEVIITDTVGFIKDLPKDLIVSFKATLEELEDANLLLHVIDSSNPACEKQITSVNNILQDLKLNNKEIIMIFNKSDIADQIFLSRLISQYNGINISANNSKTLNPLINKMQNYFTNC